MRFSALLLAVLVIGPTALVAQSNAPKQTAGSELAAMSAPEQTAFQNRTPRYRIRNGDSFELQFAFSPEFNQAVTVQPDGYITLKSIGTVVAQGFTVPQLTKNIEQAYSGILHDPVVTINLKNFDEPYFIVTGQVGKPGKYELRSDLTVTEGVAIAGGFKYSSKHSNVLLFRPGANGLTEARVINTKKMLSSRNLSEDIHLRPGDMIYVPQNKISKIQRYLPTSSLGMYAYPGVF